MGEASESARRLGREQREKVFTFLAASPLVRAGFCGFTAQYCTRPNHHAKQATAIQYCPSLGDILVTVQRKKEAETEPGYLFAICGRKREAKY